MAAEHHSLWSLFSSFFRVGFFTFGGGLAMIPFIEDEFVNRRKWITSAEMSENVALSQSFPGVVAINVSIIIGYQIAGVAGAVVAAVATILPALLSIVAILMFLQGFEDNRYVQMVFVGIKAASAALILDTVIRQACHSIHNKFGIVVAALALIVVMFDFSAVWSILLGAVAGFVFCRKPVEK